MRHRRKIFLSIRAAALLASLLVGAHIANAQARLTYPELNTALQVKVPNQSFKNRTELINWLIGQVKTRKVDKPLTKDREDDLRQAGATEELLAAIKLNSPPPPKEVDTVVNLGELASRAVNLIKPEYTPEARQAGINGVVTLQLNLDEQGRVTDTKTLAGLPNGLTEQAVAAAKNSTFSPATVNGKPAKGLGTITYNFKINKIDVASTLALGDDYRNKSNCGAAIVEYSKVILVDTKQSKAFLGRGICYVINKSYDLAITDFDSATKLAPSDDQGFFYTALAYDYKGEPRIAAKNYEQAISLNRELEKWPLMECVFVDRRQVPRDELKDFGENLIKACNTSLQSAPEYLTSLIYLKRGIGFRLKQDFDRSIADLESSRRLYPRFAAIQPQLQISYNARGLAHYDKKEYKEAIDDVTAAINLNPQNPTPFVNRCAFYAYGLKNYDQAISDCSAAIRLNDRATMAYNHRGYAYEMKKNLTAAIADYKKALDVDPRNDTARSNLDRVQKASSKN
jgi:TonB family protein